MINFKSTRELIFLGAGIFMFLLVLFILYSSIGFLAKTLDIGLKNRNITSPVQHFDLNAVEQLKK
ncbi:MAG: hypothetical protein PHP03_03530 [Candidatus Pacebacteria bacterium]|nr:hypothetical protein [Candidatus Paceibacterota bacterium]